MRVVAIDLGVRVAGLAVFEGLNLVHASEVYSDGTVQGMARALFAAGYTPGPRSDIWVVEKMVKYGKKPARDADLDRLSEIAARLRDLLPPPHQLREITARRWKGSTPKSVTAHRVKEALSAGETRTIKEDTKETMDAIGLGMFYVGRSKRGIR